MINIIKLNIKNKINKKYKNIIKFHFQKNKNLKLKK